MFRFQVAKGLAFVQCAQNEECNSERGLVCQAGTCQCREDTKFWSEDSSSCGTQVYSINFIISIVSLYFFCFFFCSVKKALNEEKCSPRIFCNGQIGLSCINSTCSCAENFFFDGQVCSKNRIFVAIISYMFIFESFTIIVC